MLKLEEIENLKQTEKENVTENIIQQYQEVGLILKHKSSKDS
jgi:hypothetical protein